MNRRPPGPKDWLFGLTFVAHFRRRPLHFLTELARTHGDVVYFRVGPARSYLVNHPDLIREVLVTRARNFRKLERQKRVFRKIDGNGLINSEGEFWLRQRRLMQPAFQSRRLARYAQVVVDCARRRLEAWPDRAVVNLEDEMTQLSLEVITRTLFGVELAGEAARLAEVTEVLRETIMREFVTLFPLPDWLPLPHKRRLRWAIRTLDGFIRNVIRQRRATREDQGDLLSMLLLAVDEEGDGRGMSDEQARDEAMTLFNGGHDSTSAGLSWACYLLARHPDVQARLVEEVETVLGNGSASYADLPRLRYMQMVVKETLRLYPPTWVLMTREAVDDVELGGYVIPRGGWVNLSPYVTQRDPRWFPEPERFDPERFVPGRVEQLPEYAYFPFGGGPHVCIGNVFAMMEMTMIVATLVQRFHLQLAGSREVEPELRVALRPKGGLPMTLSRRPEFAAIGTEEHFSKARIVRDDQ
jgi:cytochrome P450